MAHFAEVKNGIVTQVIVAEKDFIDTLENPKEWVQTSYNTYGGKHTLGGTPLRKNYAGIGYTYDTERDAFIPPQPYPSWKLDTDTCLWESPIPYPDDNKEYIWNESEQEWTYTGYFFEDGEIKKEEIE
jgi:hypothetical protein